jgi:phage terminase large subunit-like protein
VYKPVASDSDTLDGLNVHCVLMDEFHQWRNGRPLYNIMADGVSAREQPLIFMTSTAGTVREDIYDDKYDEATLIINGYSDENGYHDDRHIAFVYELDARSEWTDPKCWKKANPGLGTIKNLKTLEDKVERAKSNSSMVKNLVCKEFNVRETVGESWLTFEEADNRETFDITELKPNYGIGGYDLSSTTDLTAAVVIFRVPNDERTYVMSMFWLPADLLDKRVQEDDIRYDQYRDQGILRTCPGNRIVYKDVVAWFKEIQDTYNIYLPWHGYDNWSAIYMVEEMRGEFGKESQEAVIQGKKTLSSPMQNLGADLRAHRVIYNNNACMKWNLTNVSVDIDVNGNIQPIKGTSSKRRIDGFAALLNAYVALERKMENYNNLI